MVIERIISVECARQPTFMFLVGGIIAIFCLLVSALVVRQLIGWLTSFLITIVMTPLMLDLLRYEEARDGKLANRSKVSLFQRYGMLFKVYAAFFSGIILSFSLLYSILPAELSTHLFADQLHTILALRGGFTLTESFNKIFLNNVGVLVTAFAFSLLFGAGAIFILSWNASVLATAIGMTAAQFGGIKAIPLAILTYLPHGSVEIAAYFVGAIAGGLLSTALLRRKHPWFWVTVKDSFCLLCLAVCMLAIAALIESLLLVF